MSHPTSLPQAPVAGPSASRRPWTPPLITELPKLSELTLQSVVGGPLDGGGSTGNPSTVF